MACYGHWLNRAGCQCRTGVTSSRGGISTCTKVISIGSACEWTFITDGSELLKRIDIITSDVLRNFFYLFYALWIC